MIDTYRETKLHFFKCQLSIKNTAFILGNLETFFYSQLHKEDKKFGSEVY